MMQRIREREQRGAQAHINLSKITSVRGSRHPWYRYTLRVIYVDITVS